MNLQRAPRWLTALLAAAGPWLLAVGLAGVVEPFELKTLDWRMRTLRRPEAFRADFIFVNVSQPALTYGRKEQGWSWPWPREVWGDIIAYAGEGGAKAFVSDIGFTEDDARGAVQDRRLGEAAGKFGRFVLATPFTSDPSDRSDLPEEFVRRFSVPVTGTPAALDVFVVPPVESIWKGTKRVAGARLPTDDDGVHRRYPLLFRCAGAYYPSMALAALMELSGAKTIAAEPGLLVVGDLRIPVDAEGCFRMTYHVRDVDVTRHDAGVVISSAIRRRDGESFDLGPEVFKDKVVFLAAWAPGLLDFRATPMSGSDAAALVHATALSNLLERQFLARVPRAATALLLALFCAGIALVTRLLRPAVAVPAAIGGLALWFGSTLGLWNGGLWLDLVAPMAGGALTFAAVSVLNYVVEGRQRARVKRAFQQYLAPNVVEKILRKPGELKLEGDRKPLTIMFMDFAGFTTLSESLEPVELVKTLNEYNTETVAEIHKYDGTLDKFIGDAVMAFWNDPVDLADHEARACLAAVGIQERLGALAEKMRERGLSEMHARIGINTGIVTVGNMGSVAQFNYTAIGDQVNLASRLEGVNKEFGTNIIASESTFEKARDRVEARELALIGVKGRKKPVRIFEILGRKGEVPPERVAKARAFEKALELLRKREWAKAREAFAAIGDTPSKVYIEVCNEYEQNPPDEDWDGSYVMTHK